MLTVTKTQTITVIETNTNLIEVEFMVSHGDSSETRKLGFPTTMAEDEITNELARYHSNYIQEVEQ